jgi:hypothetical protein
MKTIEWFISNEWNELNRFRDGVLIESVTCTPENYENLFRSQFDKSGYGETYTYELWNGQ